MSLLSLLAGCAPCPPWSEVTISGHGSIDPGALREIQGAFAEFVALSGRAGSCATRIDVYPELEDGAGEIGGDYRPLTGQIRLNAAHDDLWTATTHELCHAVDDQEGWSADNPDLFDPDALLEGETALVEESYGWWEQSFEAFAQICEDGVEDVGLWEVSEAVCGIPLTFHDLPPRRFVQDHVYRGAPRVPWGAPTFELEGADEGWTLPYAEEDQALLAIEADASALVALYAGDGADPRAGPPARARRLDPWTGEVRAAYGWDPCPGREGETCRFELLPGEGGPWVQAHDEREVWLWELGADGPRAAPGCGRRGRLVAGGALWGSEGSHWGDGSGLWSCRLATGEESFIPDPTADLPLEGQGSDAQAAVALAAGSRFALWWRDSGVAWLDEDGETWRFVPLPGHLGVSSVHPLADGTWLLAHLSFSDVVGEHALALSRLDPLTGELSAPADPCPLPAGSYPRIYGGEGWAVQLAASELSETAVFSAHPLVIR